MFTKPKHAGGKRGDAAGHAAAGRSAVAPSGWTAIKAGAGVVFTDSPRSCLLGHAGDGGQTLHVRAGRESPVSLLLRGVDGLSLDVIIDGGLGVRVIVDGLNRVERLASTRVRGAAPAAAGSSWTRGSLGDPPADGNGVFGKAAVTVVPAVSGGRCPLYRYSRQLSPVVPAVSGGRCAPMLSIGGMSLDSTDVLLKSVDLTLGPPRLRSVMDSVVYGRGAVYGTGVACIDEDSLLTVADGAALRLDGATTPGANPLRFDQQAGVAAVTDVLRAVDKDGKPVRMAAYSLSASRAVSGRLAVDESSAVYRRIGPLSPWRRVPVSEATPKAC